MSRAPQALTSPGCRVDVLPKERHLPLEGCRPPRVSLGTWGPHGTEPDPGAGRRTQGRETQTATAAESVRPSLPSDGSGPASSEDSRDLT